MLEAPIYHLGKGPALSTRNKIIHYSHLLSDRATLVYETKFQQPPNQPSELVNNPTKYALELMHYFTGYQACATSARFIEQSLPPRLSFIVL